MVCACIGDCELVSRRDRGDCTEISLNRRRLVGLAANDLDWYKWVKGLIERLIRIYAEWMSQRRTVEAQGDEEHNLGVIQSPAPAIPQSPSIFPVDND
jgi:hypothetical protein